MLYLVTAEIKGVPPHPSREFVEASLQTMERLVQLRGQGKVQGGGIFSGRMGLCFILDAESNEQMNETIVGLRSFAHAQWTVTPLHAFEVDIAITRRVLEAMSSGADWRK